MHKKRLLALRDLMHKAKLQAILITHPVNRHYLSGFTGSSGALYITLDSAVLFTDFRYMNQAPGQAKDFEVIEHAPQMMESVKERLQADRITSLGFEAHEMTYEAYERAKESLDPVKLISTKDLVEQIRKVKDQAELQIMKEAAELADKAYTHILSYIRPGVSESDVALELEFFMRKHGATSTSFETIVASGERSALPHGVASERIIGKNEFVKLDYGAYYKGYCSDITRTVFVGKPENKHKEMYDIVREAQCHAIDHLRPGMTCQEADALARDIITRHGYKDQFGHATGHGLGMEIHEMPRVSPKSTETLLPGMTVTIEPGIYLPSFGGVRIEDDVVITEQGAQRLTKASKDWEVL